MKESNKYTIKKMAEMAGVSQRTLRYYDEIGLLKPCEVSEAGYRLYSEKEIDRLQQILFYKYLGFELANIQEIMNQEEYYEVEALRKHLGILKVRQKELATVIRTIENTIAYKGGKMKMSNQEKFQGLKENIVKKNQEKYEKERIEKYGAKAIEEADAKFLSMSKEQYEKQEALSIELNQAIKEAFATKNPNSKEAKRACELHKEWLMGYWTSYTKEAHMGLVNMYVEDTRFKSYYDAIVDGAAVFLQQAMKVYLDM